MSAFSNVLRLIALAEGAFIIGMVVYVFQLAGKAHGGTSLLRASPRHIYGVAFAHTLACVFIMLEIASRLGDRALTVRTPAALVIFTLTLLAIFDMARALSFRVRAKTPTPDQVREGINDESDLAAAERKLDAALERGEELEQKLGLDAGDSVPSAAIVTKRTPGE